VTARDRGRASIGQVTVVGKMAPDCRRDVAAQYRFDRSWPCCGLSVFMLKLGTDRLAPVAGAVIRTTHSGRPAQRSVGDDHRCGLAGELPGRSLLSPREPEALGLECAEVTGCAPAVRPTSSVVTQFSSSPASIGASPGSAMKCRIGRNFPSGTNGGSPVSVAARHP